MCNDQPTLSDRDRELCLICTPSMEGGALGLRAVRAAKAGLSSNFDTHKLWEPSASVFTSVMHE